MPDEKPLCFIISPIGAEGSETRIRADKVSRHLIEKAAAIRGFQTLRADKMSDAGMITSQVIQLIIDAPMVIADLSGHNANVFYELAIRHALRKPYVQIIDKTFKIPFDLSGTRTVIFDLHDPDVLESNLAELVEKIKAVEGKEDVDSPISNAIDVAHMRQSGDPEQRQLADLMSGFAELKQAVQTIAETLSPRTMFPISGSFGQGQNVSLADLMGNYRVTGLGLDTGPISSVNIGPVGRIHEDPQKPRLTISKKDRSK